MKIDAGQYNFDIKPLYPNSRIGKAAIYTIWTFDPSADGFILLYVGKCGNDGITLDEKGENFSYWTDLMISSLYIAVEYLPADTFTKKERIALGNKLIREHRPLCNF